MDKDFIKVQIMSLLLRGKEVGGAPWGSDWILFRHCIEDGDAYLYSDWKKFKSTIDEMVQEGLIEYDTYDGTSYLKLVEGV